MGDHAALLIYPPHGQGATNDVDNAEAFAFYEINLHLHYLQNYDDDCDDNDEIDRQSKCTARNAIKTIKNTFSRIQNLGVNINCHSVLTILTFGRLYVRLFHFDDENEFEYEFALRSCG